MLCAILAIGIVPPAVALSGKPHPETGLCSVQSIAERSVRKSVSDKVAQ